MFDVDIEYLKQRYKYSCIFLLGINYADNQEINSSGAAVIVDTEANIAVTNAHVVAGYDHMFAYTCFQAQTKQLPEQSTVEKTDMLVAQVIYIENHLDLALLQLIELADLSQLLPIMPLVDRPHELGEQVAILGHGAGQWWIVIVGYITTNTPFDTISETQYVPLGSILDKSESFVLHQSNTIPGTSGAPIVDAKHRIIGINSGILELSNKPKIGTHSKTVNAFLGRAGSYVRSYERDIEKFNRNQHYYPKSDYQLGIVLSKNTDINTDFMVVDVIDKRMTVLQINDMILEINGQPFTDINQMTDAINSFGVEIILNINRINNVMPVIVNSFDYESTRMPQMV
ncbi:serine protease HTR4-like [Oppia nitens]|uniref:serine protease HTR4-like n=1 Tax=Oppia nitens TaxID=1686743 RepID=UPI0023DC1B20|nr:serine protease HTR4-like [Oppia nitens]